MPTKYQTGNFGPITQSYLEKKGQNGTVITTETILNVCGSGNPTTSGSTDTAGASNQKVAPQPTGYEDYTTDEIETSTENTAANTAGTEVSGSQVNVATTSGTSDKKSFYNPLGVDNDAIEQ